MEIVQNLVILKMEEKRSKFNIKFLPKDFQKHILNIKQKESFSLTLSNPRKSKLGDYRYNHKFKSHHITINIDLEPIYFMVTYLHEVAHKMCWDQFNHKAKPHGQEWKHLFVSLLWNFKSQIKLSHSDNEIILNFISNPQARFQKFNNCKNDLKVSNLKPESIFELESGETFQLIKKRRTRFLCLNTKNKQQYTILGNTLIKKIHSGGIFITE